MNSTPRLCVELNGCIANNLAFLGVPDFGIPDIQTLPIVGAIEALAWLNGPFAYNCEVHITVSCTDSEFHEQAMQWLHQQHFSLRTGITDTNIHPYQGADELARMTSGMRPTVAVHASVETLSHMLLADTQLLLDPNGMQLKAYNDIRQERLGMRIQRLTSWREIMQICTQSLTEIPPT